MTDIAEAVVLRGPSGEPTHYVLTAEMFADLRERAGLDPIEDDEDEEDRRALAEARAGDDGFRLPSDVVGRLIEGENVIRVLRTWRGIDQAELARRMGTAPNYISQIETGARRGARKAEAFAAALDVPVELIKGRL